MNARLVRLTIAFALLTSVAATLSAQDSAMQGLADYLSISLSQPPKRTVAVVDFTDLQGNVTNLGRFLAAQVESDVIGSGKGIDLVDRTRLQLIMQEHKLTTTGIIDPATARQLGKFAGVQILITGTITPLTDTIHLTIKAINTEDARIVAAKSKDILKTRDIMVLLGQSAVPPPASGAEPPAVNPGGNPSAPRSTVPRNPQIFNAHNFEFQLISCDLSGNSVICNLIVTNKDDDRSLTISAGWGGKSKTKIFDDQGRETLVSDSKLGSHIQGDYGVGGTMISGVPTRAQLVFEKVPSNTLSISKIEIGCEAEGKEFPVWFKKIPILGVH